MRFTDGQVLVHLYVQYTSINNYSKVVYIYMKRSGSVQLIVDDAGQVVLEKQTTCRSGINAHAKMSRLNNACEGE